MRGNSRGSFYFAELANGWTVGRFHALDHLASFVHAITTRTGFDVALAARRPGEAARQLAEVLGLDGIAFCRQVHGNVVAPATRAGSVGEADGLVTGVSRLGLAGFGADCPILLAADPASGAVGMAHASWRGTAGRIASRLVRELVDRFGAAPADVVACIGPSAGPCCYEVGDDVIQAALAGIGRHAEGFLQARAGKTYFDLWAANADELLRAGLCAEHVHTAGLCTLCRNDVFPSYRREGLRAGRFVSVIAKK